MAHVKSLQRLLSLLTPKTGIKFDPQSAKKLAGGYRNFVWRLHDMKGTSYCLVIYKSEPNIAAKISAAHASAAATAKTGLPVRLPIYNVNQRTEVIQLTTQRANSVRNSEPIQRLAVLYPFLSGETLPWNGFNAGHLHNLGRALALIHQSELMTEKDKLPVVETSLLVQLESSWEYINSESRRDALKTKLKLSVDLEKLAELLNQMKDFDWEDNPRRLLHLDLVRSNLLFKKEELTGIIDFEKTAIGPVELDVARTLAFLIVDQHHKSPSQIWRSLYLNGYLATGKQKLNRANLKLFTYYFWWYDFYKFLLHNPYEDLPKNWHFRRTVAKLRGMILDR